MLWRMDWCFGWQCSSRAYCLASDEACIEHRRYATRPRADRHTTSLESLANSLSLLQYTNKKLIDISIGVLVANCQVKAIFINPVVFNGFQWLAYLSSPSSANTVHTNWDELWIVFEYNCCQTRKTVYICITRTQILI